MGIDLDGLRIKRGTDVQKSEKARLLRGGPSVRREFGHVPGLSVGG